MKFRNYLVKTLNGMALGLFSSLIIGLIIKQIGELLDIPVLIMFGQIAQVMMGPAIGAAVAYSIGASPIAIFASTIAGAIGAGTVTSTEAGLMTIGIGEPVGAFIASLAAAEFSKLIAGKTKMDIILVPLLTILMGGFVGVTISPIMSSIMTSIGQLINTATELRPVPMGILVAVMMGILLTLPISSAAIAISLGLSGIAAGASLVGCCCQMVGFAVISYEDNGIGGSTAIGLGTSMIQIPNIIKNPWVWLPSIIASAILGPISTKVVGMTTNSVGAGMGTSGLVGQISTLSVMGYNFSTYMIILTMQIILPGLLAFICYKIMKKKNLIQSGDLKLPEAN